MKFIPNTLSTNTLLKEFIQTGDESGKPLENFFALYTNHQSNGRGMGTNRWFSDDGCNILASFHFTPEIPAQKQFLFNIYFALTTADFLDRYTSDVEIKWPNDIYIRKHKIAGILIEHSIRGNSIHHTVAGIGININQDKFPDDIPYPTSLFLETGVRHEPTQLLNEYHELLKSRFPMLKTENEQMLRNLYMQRLYQYNEYHPYLIRGTKCSARITDLDPYGQLQLETTDGQTHTLAFKEVVYLRNENDTRP